MVPAWKTMATSTGESGDLRLVFPYMIAGVQPYIGANSGQIVRVDIRGDDKEVQALRTGAAPK